MLLSIIIVSHNTKALLEQCLKSISSQPLARSTDHLLETIVVDNASTDGSPELVARSFPQVKLIRNSINLGFGQANDLGAQVATGDYLLFLNSDTHLPALSLSQIIDHTRSRKPAIASFRLTHPDGSLQPQGGALPTLLNLFLWMVNLDNLPGVRRFIMPYQARYPQFFQRDRLVGWVAGTAMLIKRSVFQNLNGFDPHIFMYAEDVELCFRAHQEGYAVTYFSTPSIIHYGQASGSAERSVLGEIKGMHYYYRQHKPGWQYPLLRLTLKLGCLLRVVVFAIIGKQNETDLYQKAFKLA